MKDNGRVSPAPESKPVQAPTWFALAVNFGADDAEMHLFRIEEEMRQFTCVTIFGTYPNMLPADQRQPWETVNQCLSRGFAAKVAEGVVLLWRRGTIRELFNDQTPGRN